LQREEDLADFLAWLPASDYRLDLLELGGYLSILLTRSIIVTLELIDLVSDEAGY
jgi:hypothetical protein